MNKKILVFSSVLAIALLAFSSFVMVSKVNAYALTAAGAPICNNSAPGMPYISSLRALGGGSVEVSWSAVSSASDWTVAYGVRSHTYIYGIHNFGNGESRSVRINSLPAGRYYFALRANNGCMPGAFSNELAVTVGGGAVQATLQPRAGTFQATPTPTTVRGGTVQTPRPTATVRPGLGIPAGTPSSTPRPTFWQGLMNFFGSLFGR